MRETFYSWNEYSFRFQKEAQERNIPQNAALELLAYAEPLFKRSLPIIYDLVHFSYLTGYRATYIQRAIKNPNNFYRRFNIKKKNGQLREITEPLPGLKEIQNWILYNILQKIDQNKFNNAFAKGRSIVTNAKYHTKQEKILNLDIEKYFDNIPQISVADFFSKLGYNNLVSTLLARICSLNNGLPQGSSTSPYLSSLITSDLDKDLFGYCRSKSLRYSRYADDITISGSFQEGSIIADVRITMKKYGFKIHPHKTTVKRQHQRQLVTGVVVNKKLSVNKTDIRKIRQALYFLVKYGLVSHCQFIQNKKKSYLQHLLGKINFYLHLKKNDPELLRLKSRLHNFIKDNNSSSPKSHESGQL